MKQHTHVEGKSKPYPDLTCELPPLAHWFTLQLNQTWQWKIPLENPFTVNEGFFSWESHRFPWYIGISNYPRPTQRLLDRLTVSEFVPIESRNKNSRNFVFLDLLLYLVA